jgi:hypothetical protein
VDLYIVFAERTGEDENGNYFYRLLFSNDPEIVWGDNFNVTPAGIVPDLEPDSASIKKEYLLTTGVKLETAVESTWFSFQDCIDDIIPLLFNGIGEKIVAIPFGMEIEKVQQYIEWLGGTLKNVKYEPKKNEKENGEEES